ncbi:protein FAR-RED IMPAIRED RESPONSE 1-like [Apium graveolens]|uniref:protein FAR-RED IMPAIRED RESPONSE 1-like n=1 Tax=Apium graveolens TaxID=4045 RepID=UPI003D78D0A2
MIIDKFKRTPDKSKSFFYAYDVDSYSRLTKLFWADSIGRRNFELYGDAISFDATFDTNSWAFGHLVKAMGRNHVLIITDQCLAMKVFVRDVFSDVNGLLGNRLYKETDFMEKMKTYIWSSIIETEEFESGWETIIKEFNLENNKLLQDMYALKASWNPAFFRNEPMFGLLRTTSRSESENSFFGQFHKQEDTLCEFWLRFERAMDKQMNETEEILASCLKMQIKRMSEEVNGVTHFEIRDVRVKDKLFKVSVSMNHAVCSCKKFVMCGIVCRHAFCGLK